MTHTALLDKKQGFTELRGICTMVRRVGQASLPAMWSCHDSLEAVTQAQNSGIKIANHKTLKSQTQRLNFVPRLQHFPF